MIDVVLTLFRVEAMLKIQNKVIDKEEYYYHRLNLSNADDPSKEYRFIFTTKRFVFYLNSYIEKGRQILYTDVIDVYITSPSSLAGCEGVTLRTS